MVGAWPMKLIDTQADVDRGAAWLAAFDSRFGIALGQTGPLPLRRKAGGFAALVDAIISQQVSVASAAAIWKRVSGAGFTQAGRVLAASDDDLRNVGLSRPKVRYLRALAEADLPYEAFKAMPDTKVTAALTQVLGIGVWSAEIYLLSSLGRADVFPAGDIALQEASRDLFGLEARPDEKVMRVMAAAWAPHRSVAARLLWAYYRVIKSREGIR